MPRTAAASAKANESPGDAEPESFAVDHICFLPLSSGNDTVLWPALTFENYAAMKAFDDRRGILPKREHAAILRKLFLGIMAKKCSNDPVALLLGTRNPTGERCMFSPPQAMEFVRHLEEAREGTNKDLKEALEMVQDILASDDDPSTSPSGAAKATSQETTLSVRDQSVTSNEAESSTKPIKRKRRRLKNANLKPIPSSNVLSVEETESVDGTLSFVASDDCMTSSEPDTAEKPLKRKRRGRPKKGTLKPLDEVESVAETLSFVGSDQSMMATPVEKPKRKRGRPKKVDVVSQEKSASKACNSQKKNVSRKRKVPASSSRDDASSHSRHKRAKSVKATAKKTTASQGQRSALRHKCKAGINQTPTRRHLEIEAGYSPDLWTTSVASASLMPAKLPSFNDVQPLLKKAGFKFPNGRYILPGVDPSDDKFVQDRDYFDRVSRLRRYLCAYGIWETGFEWKEEEKACLSLWVRTAIVPGLWGRDEVPNELRFFFTGSQLHGLFDKLGFQYTSDGSYYLPGVKPVVTGGISINGRKMMGEDGLLVYLARFGLPPSCTFQNLSKEERLHLEYHISQDVKIAL